MKKSLSILLVLLMVLLLPVAAMAEDANIYVDPTDTYGYAYPDGWLQISKETIADTMADYEGDEEMIAVMQNALAQMETVEMSMVISPDGLHNVNLVVVDLGVKVSAQDLLAQSGGIQNTLSQTMPGIQFAGEAEIIQMGDYEYVLLGYLYSLDGINYAGMQAYTGQGTSLYTFTLTSILQSEDAVETGIDALSYVLLTAELN